MNSIEKNLLQRLMIACNKLGSPIDRTAISEIKLYEFQQAHMLVSNVLYGILSQHKENEYAKEDMDKAINSLNKIEILTDKEY